MVNGWSGFRGAVSLAAALAVPATTDSGSAFPDRELIFFVTAVVILVTVLVQGVTLPAVVRWAHLPADTAREQEVRLAHVTSAQAALEALPRVAAELGVDGDVLAQARSEFEDHAAATRAQDDGNPADDAVTRWQRGRDLRLGVLAHKRQALTALRDANRIDDIVLRELQASMDLEETRLLGPLLSD